MSNDYTKITKQLQTYKHVQGLMKYINYESILEEHKKQEKGKATGIDGIGKVEYEEEHRANIEEIINEMKAFKYRPIPVRRVYIPKAGSDKLRPLGIPAYRDKLVQGVFAKILNTIYENIFLNCSYGFRPGRSCHDAIAALNKIIQEKRVNYIVDADIKGFFENVDHKWLIKFLEYTIQDKHFIRYIGRGANKSNTSKCIFALCIRLVDRKRYKEKIQRGSLANKVCR